jgi:hypothetical protein
LPFMLGRSAAVLLGLVNGVAIVTGASSPSSPPWPCRRGPGPGVVDERQDAVSLLELDFVREVGGAGWRAPLRHRVHGRHCSGGCAQPHPLRPPCHRRGRQPRAAARRRRRSASRPASTCCRPERRDRGRAALRRLGSAHQWPATRCWTPSPPWSSWDQPGRGGRRSSAFLGVITFGLLFNLSICSDMPTELNNSPGRDHPRRSATTPRPVTVREGKRGHQPCSTHDSTGDRRAAWSARAGARRER